MLPDKIRATHLRDQYLAAIENGDQLGKDTIVIVLSPYEVFQAIQAGCFTDAGQPPLKGAKWTGRIPDNTTNQRKN